MIDRKITIVRDEYYEYDDAKVMTMPRIAFVEKLANMIRTLYRKIKFFFYSTGIILSMLLFVNSSKYDILQKLHYRDLLDGMKKD